MRTEEEKRKLKEQAKRDLKKDFTSGKKPPKKETSKKFGCGGFGK